MFQRTLPCSGVITNNMHPYNSGCIVSLRICAISTFVARFLDGIVSKFCITLILSVGMGLFNGQIMGRHLPVSLRDNTPDSLSHKAAYVIVILPIAIGLNNN